MKVKTVYLILPAVLIAGAVFFFALIAGGDLSIVDIIDRGGSYLPLTLRGEWWRLISALLVHSTLWFALISSFLVLIFLPMTIELYGLAMGLGLFFVAGVVGHAASLLFSGSLFSFGTFPATMGALIAILLHPRAPQKIDQKWLVLCVFCVVGLALMSFVNTHINLVAILAGAAVGLAARWIGREPRKLAIASFVVAIVVGISLSFPKAKFNYLSMYQSFLRDSAACLDRSEPLLVDSGHSGERAIANSSAMLDTILKTSCRPALQKSEQIAATVIQYMALEHWNRQVEILDSIAVLLESERRILQASQLKIRLKRMQKKKRWGEMLETIEGINTKEVSELIDQLKHITSPVHQKIARKKIERLSAAAAFYGKLEKTKKQLAALVPNGKDGPTDRLSMMTARFEEKRQTCFDYVDKIELSKDYHFADFQAQLESILRESCRPALFLTERLIGASLSDERKAYWNNNNQMVRKLIWKVHSTLEVIRAKEFEHQIAKLQYEGDWNKIRDLKKTRMAKRINKIQILLSDFKERFGARTTTRDDFVLDQLSKTLLRYHSVQSKTQRVPASSSGE